MDGLPGNYHVDSSSTMKSLPLHLLDDILFRLEPKSIAMMRCTDRYFKSHISDDPMFEIGYFSRAIPNLLHIYGIYITYVYFQPLVSPWDTMSEGTFRYESMYGHHCSLFGSSSGLLLLYINGLFVANPLTKRFRFLDHSGSILLPRIVGGASFMDRNDRRAMCVGFVVNPTTKRFKIACILEMQKRCGFEISDGDSWRLSKTTINDDSKSDLTTWMKPVYLHGTLHWFRNDGSIMAFNPETEQGRFIPSTFHREKYTKLLFAADGKTNRLTLISGTKETISFYTLLGKPKWTLARRIKNVSMEDNRVSNWKLVTYDGTRLVVRVYMKYAIGALVHVYDMEADSWRVLGSATKWESDSVWNSYMFTPSFFSVEEDAHNYKAIVASKEDDPRIYYLRAVMGIK
ncbi:PREDICTED: F-box protein At1g20360-like [Camelina sativa]|uniref:F-box protein At1g20360-like n=1 Tax=Camelina sativa TaxID=90675 RepID=A0ABM0WWR3_CAMSA|nr:PREDICTED: F-box protein At1g20360-like [Camelina sativa]